MPIHSLPRWPLHILHCNVISTSLDIWYHLVFWLQFSTCTLRVRTQRSLFFSYLQKCVMVVLVLTNHYTPCRNHFFAAPRHPVLKPIIWPFWAGMSKGGNIGFQKLKETGRKYFRQIHLRISPKATMFFGLKSITLRWALCWTDTMQQTNLCSAQVFNMINLNCASLQMAKWQMFAICQKILSPLPPAMEFL